MEKIITISSIGGKFTKDFDTFGKMDPFFQIKCGKFTQKTDVAHDQGKQPKWTKTFTFQITNQKQIQIICYDEDVTENQYMGTGKIQIANLKKSATQQLPILDKDKKNVGMIIFNYQIKQNSAPVQSATKIAAQQKQKPASTTKIVAQQKQKPTINLKDGAVVNNLQKNINQNIGKKVVGNQNLLKGTGDKRIILSNIGGKFTKDFDTLGKMDVFLKFYLGLQELQTEQAADMGKQPKWKSTINFEFTDQIQIIVKSFDSDVTEDQFMGLGKISLKQLKDSGKNQITLLGEDKKSIGVIYFNYQLKQLKPLPEKKKTEVIVPPVIKKQQIKAQKKEQKKVIQQPKQEKKVVQQPKQQKNKIPSQPSNRKTEPQIKIQRADILIQKKPIIVEKKRQQQNDIQNSNVSKRQDPNRTINKSINSIRLPQIGDISKNYGDKIFDKQSSATLQKSILVYSMPKASRFGSGPKYCGQPSYYVDTCFKPNATKGVGFGFGAKRQFPEWMEKNMKQNPAPGSYFEDSSKKGQYKQKGPTFGISYKYYQKVTIPKQKSPEKQTVSTKRLVPILRSK